MHAQNLVEQVRIRSRALTGRAPAPGVEAAGADLAEAAQALHRVRVLVALDEGESFARSSEVKAIAFFKRSCSTFNCS